MLDLAFIETAQRYFNPYVLASGTEHVAVLLYALARMTRPRVIVEYGSGYTTLFLLRALADNLRDWEEERSSLLEKSERWLATVAVPPPAEERPGGPVVNDEDAEKFLTWFSSGHKACNVAPSHYLEVYDPHLYAFDRVGRGHPYVQTLQDAVRALRHEQLFSCLHGRFSYEALPDKTRAIDWAWNDDNDYIEFFCEFWPHLNPSGGLLIFHNVLAHKPFFDAIVWMKEQRAAEGDVEVLMLEERHKIVQNSCAILRKVSERTPRFAETNPLRNWHAAADFVSRSR